MQLDERYRRLVPGSRGNAAEVFDVIVGAVLQARSLGLGELPGDGDQPLTVLINPVIEPIGDEMALGWEGCLSVPGLRGVVPRYLRVRYRGLGLDGQPIEREAAGFHARVVQHECDHLDGILYPQRMTDHRLLVYTEELQRHPIDLAEFLKGEAE